ncbi:MAG: NADH-quinone oxidoreductase subunit C [Desulfuromonadaceae bacterium]|nr:NADH-quinone oxidoreductase subunit C [Desulfuromonadaceae bacterium]
MNIKAMQKKWLAIGAEVEETGYAKTGYDFNLNVAADNVHPLAELMLAEGFYLVFVTAVHALPAIEVVYQFAHTGSSRCRVIARTAVRADGTVPTISDVYQGANWHEREARDFYGVVFAGHPNLVPLILAEEDVDLKPLLKEEKNLKDVSALRHLPAGAEPEVKTATAAAKKEPAATDKKAAQPQASN